MIKRIVVAVVGVLAVASMLATPAEAARYRVRGWRGYGYRGSVFRPRVYGYGGYARGYGVYGPRFYNRGFYGAPLGGGYGPNFYNRGYFGAPLGGGFYGPVTPWQSGLGMMTPPML
jgi:hypothetical protein